MLEKQTVHLQQETKERLKVLEPQMVSMINKLDVILELNEHAKKNDIYKERLH